jgi:hypothetical protein
MFQKKGLENPAICQLAWNTGEMKGLSPSFNFYKETTMFQKSKKGIIPPHNS